MRVVALIVLTSAMSGGAYALAQSESAAQQPAVASSSREAPEEVIVRGRQIGELRARVQQTREHAYAIFNEINSNDDFDVLCRDERKYHSRAKKRVCRARFEDRIAADAAKEYLGALNWLCQGDSVTGAIDWQACMFSGVGQQAAQRARAAEGQEPAMHDRMDDEMLRLARTDLRFGQAILDFYDASQRYEAARRRNEE